MRIGVIGTGYVGLVTGACFSEIGHRVTCVDVDLAKIDRLKRAELPIYEPGLDRLVADNQRSERLHFTTDLARALEDSEVVFVAVGTPQAENGSCNLQYVWNVADGIRQLAKTPKTVVVKSTVPVGTNAELWQRLNNGSSIRHQTVSNPEFLREGLAVDDCLNPERIVIGAREPSAAATMSELYSPYVTRGTPLIVMSPESAEMTKYVANCILATRISFMNEMANVCEKVAADITQVREGIGWDSRIGTQFLNAGAGYGGSCFPKDTRAMVALARAHGVELRILPQVDRVNELQKQRFCDKLMAGLGDCVEGKTIALWGLAFKPQTDDIREAPALVVIERLLAAGASIQAFDPQAINHVREIYGNRISYCDTMYEALCDAEALGILTEWDEFAAPDFAAVGRKMRGRLIVDGRNMYDPAEVVAHGFTYVGVGRVPVGLQPQECPASPSRASKVPVS